MNFTKKEAIEMANREVLNIGYPLRELRIKADENNTAWKEYVKRGPFLQGNSELQSKLSGREYWAIYYGTQEIRFGGDLWIFVDKKSCEVITVIRGQ